MKTIHGAIFAATLSSTSPLWGADFTVNTAVTSGQTLNDGNTGVVTSEGSVTTSGSTAGVMITPTTTTNSIITPTNNGTISQTGTGRAVRNNTSNKTSRIVINNNGTLSSVGDDTVKIADSTATIIINNQGTIIKQGSMADSGQALDFRNSNATMGNTIINGSVSNTSALIKSEGDDAIRPSHNMSIVNYGTIISTGPVNTKCVGTCSGDPKAHDGIDVGDKTGVQIDNYGIISGSRHAITADEEIYVVNQAGATIIGNNGSGVGSDGTGTVINYGTITGAYAGEGNVYDHSAYNGGTSTANNGDGDGVDIDGVAIIKNYGTIQGLGAGGVDSGGLPNGAEGIAAGGGSLFNYEGATIYGQSIGVLIDDGSNGTAVASGRGTTTAAGGAQIIGNRGTIIGVTKAAIGLVGNYDDTITNYASGTITGGSGSVKVDEVGSTTAAAAIQMGAGGDTLVNYGTITGQNGMAIDMGSGDDTVQLLGGTVNGTIDGGSGTDSIVLGYANNFSLSQIINFENFTIQDGASLNGGGTVNTLIINDGGILYPMASTLRVEGNLNFASGGTYRLNAYANGTSGRVDVNGNASLEGAKLVVVADSAGSWNTSTLYTILSATSLSGTFGDVATNLAFLTPSVTYDSTHAYLILTKNAVTYGDVATGGGVSVASVLDGVGSNSAMQPLLSRIDSMSASQAQSAFLSLRGDDLASLSSSSRSSYLPFGTLIATRLGNLSQARAGIGLGGLYFADAGDGMLLAQILKEEGIWTEKGIVDPYAYDYTMWAKALGGRITSSSDSAQNISSSHTHVYGTQIGIDKSDNDSVYGASFASLQSRFKTNDGQLSSTVKSQVVGVYGSRYAGDFRIDSAIDYAFIEADSERETLLGGADSQYDAKAMGIWISGAYTYKLDQGSAIEPYVELRYDRYKQDSYSEGGAGGAGLAVDGFRSKLYGAGMGAKFIHSFYENRGSWDIGVGFFKEWGDLETPLVMRFSSAPEAGSWRSTTLDRGSLICKANLGVNYKVLRLTELFATAEGQVRERERAINGTLGVKVRF